MLNWLKNRLSTRAHRQHFVVKRTLLIDETGTDSESDKITFAGCLVDDLELDAISRDVQDFNYNMLQNPRFANQGSVNNVSGARHYVEDHYTVRELFFADVVDKLPMRIYLVSADYDSVYFESVKIQLMKRLISVVQSTRGIDQLSIVAEESDKKFQGNFPNVKFRSKDYLPLSIADYVAAGARACYQIIQGAEKGRPVRETMTSFNVQFYLRLENMIAYEEDVSSKTISGRKKRVTGERLRKMVE